MMQIKQNQKRKFPILVILLKRMISLATKTALTTVENKIPDVSDLVK